MTPGNVRYDIRLAGRLNSAAREEFATFEVRVEGAMTVLSVDVDQAGLHGILERIRMLDIDLVDVRRARSEPSVRRTGDRRQ